ncbi:unnamed protein product [Prunus armeniaca]
MDPEFKSIISHLTKLKKVMAESEQQPEESYAIKLQGDVPRYVLGPFYPLQPPDEVVRIWAEQSDDPLPYHGVRLEINLGSPSTFQRLAMKNL